MLKLKKCYYLPLSFNFGYYICSFIHTLALIQDFAVCNFVCCARCTWIENVKPIRLLPMLNWALVFFGFAASSRIFQELFNLANLLDVAALLWALEDATWHKVVDTGFQNTNFALAGWSALTVWVAQLFSFRWCRWDVVFGPHDDPALGVDQGLTVVNLWAIEYQDPSLPDAVPVGF